MVRLKAKYIVVITLLFALSCKHEPGYDGRISGYPEAVGKIILSSCAVTGCHNDKSYRAAGGLNMTTWDKLFEGGSIGNPVIPYRPDFSTLCYYTNVDTTLGVTLIPTMPVNNEPLTKEEYLTIRNWVAEGAPNINGEVKFADNPTRDKVYVTNRLCDVVTVFDAQSYLQMRYIDVGLKAVEEFPHVVKVSPGKKHWYVGFFSQSNVVQQFSAVDDSWVANIELGLGSWTNMVITGNSRYGFFADNTDKGKVVYVDLEQRKVLATYNFNGQLSYLSGMALNESINKLYIGTAYGNYIYSIDITNPLQPTIKEIPIDGTDVVKHQSINDPVEVVAVAETGKCYLACQKSHEVVVMDMQKDSVLKRIALDTNPAYMSYSATKQKLFVTCPDDVNTFDDNRGSVAVIDTRQDKLQKWVYTGYQPYGIAVHDKRGMVAVVNANLSPDGDEPHHSSDCDGRNGNVTFIDLNTLELVKVNRSEVAVNPHAAAAR